MSEILKIIQERHSSRVPFEMEHSPANEDITHILEAARWAPTAHNMQNFEIIIVDGESQLEMLGNIESRVSEDFLRENFQQLSFSEEELAKKKTGILGTMFPQSWRTPGDWSKVARESEPSALDQTMRGGPTVLIVVYDARKILQIPEYMRIAYAIRLRYLFSKTSKFMRVPRDVTEYAPRNRFGSKDFS